MAYGSVFKSLPGQIGRKACVFRKGTYAEAERYICYAFRMQLALCANWALETVYAATGFIQSSSVVQLVPIK